MIKVTNRDVCRGVAGRRTGKVKGVVIHNTWDNQTASYHADRLKNMSNAQLAAGFAHYYVDENEIVRVENTYNGAWHVANYDGNMNYIGFEVRGNRSTPSKVLLQAEQNAFWQAAIDLKYYGLSVNRNTVKLHHEFSATECPKRSLIEHCGYDSTYAVPLSVTNKLKDYYIKEIKKYYDNPKLQPGEKLEGVKEPVKKEPKVLDAKKFPAMVKMVQDNKVYNNPNFGKKSLSRAIFKKDTVLYANGIVKSGSGIPRIKTPSGYILATDNYVKFL